MTGVDGVGAGAVEGADDALGLDHGGAAELTIGAVPEGAGVGATGLFVMLENAIEGVGSVGP